MLGVVGYNIAIVLKKFYKYEFEFISTLLIVIKYDGHYGN